MNNQLKILRPMRYTWLYFAISLAFIIPGVYSLLNYGLKLSIDFTGGTTLAWSVQESLSDTAIFSAYEQVGAGVEEIKHLDSKTIEIKSTPLDSVSYQAIKSNPEMAQANLTELEYSTIGPSLGSELIKKTFYGVGLSATLIMLYVAKRFRSFKYGFSAILAMLHDSLILIGIFSLLGHYAAVAVDTLFVTAVLTILSFSVHDTIVVYDRIRELKKHYVYLDYEEIVNRAVVETMGRSLNNSLTIIFMLLAMYLLGGDSIRYFVLALLIGTISGTYSSTFTAAPLLIVWDRFAKRRSS